MSAAHGRGAAARYRARHERRTSRCSRARRRQELDELFTRYPTKMACLLPALWMVQEARGWISDAGDRPRWPRCSS